MSIDELLLTLRDIQPPPSPPWWHLAPTWWVLLSVLVLMVALFLFLKKQSCRRRLVRLASQALERIVDAHKHHVDDRLLALQLSTWLKQVSLLAFPDRQLESLTGQRWLEFLDQCVGDNNFSRGPGSVFGGSIYQQSFEFDAIQVVILCRNWMSAIQPRLQLQGLH